MLENKNYKFIEVGSEDKFTNEATPSKPDKTPLTRRGSYIGSSRDEKTPVYKRIGFTLIGIVFLIIIGLLRASMGPCPEHNRYFRQRSAVWCEIGQLILKHDRHAEDTFGPINNYPPPVKQ